MLFFTRKTGHKKETEKYGYCTTHLGSLNVPTYGKAHWQHQSSIHRLDLSPGQSSSTMTCRKAWYCERSSCCSENLVSI